MENASARGIPFSPVGTQRRCRYPFIDGREDFARLYFGFLVISFKSPQAKAANYLVLYHLIEDYFRQLSGIFCLI